MDTIKINEMIKQLALHDYQNMYLDDFLLTWEKSDDEVDAHLPCGRYPAGYAATEYFQPYF